MAKASTRSSAAGEGSSNWSNANYQPAEVSSVLAGHDARYDVVSSFFSDVFGATVKVFGDVSRADLVRPTDGWCRARIGGATQWTETCSKVNLDETA